MQLAYSTRLQHRIQLLATAGILVTGLLVAIATAIPIYRDAQELATSTFIEVARGHARSAGQFIGKAHDIGRQVASRSAIRERLDAYNRGETSLADLVQFTTPRIGDALEQSGNMIALIRYDAHHRPVVELGEQIPQAHRPIPESDTSIVTGPLRFEGRNTLLISTPILARDAHRVGTDILAFDFASLGQVLGSDTMRLTHERMLLFNAADSAMLELGPDRLLPPGQPEQVMLALAAKGETGMKRLKVEGSPEFAIAYAPLPDVPGWGFAIVARASTLDAPVLARIASPLLTILALVVGGAFLTTRAIRPLTNKVLEQSRQLTELNENMALSASVFEGSPQAILILDSEHRILEANTACCTITGFALFELRGRTVCELLCLDGNEGGWCETQWASVDESGEWFGEVTLKRNDGSTFPAWYSLSAVSGTNGRPTHYVAMMADISEEKATEERIRHLAHHDSLTGLPNRSLLNDRLDHALERARRNGKWAAVLFVDLDRFKTVNDSLGHPVGDLLLKEVANRLGASVREQDTVARQGGDEFVILLEDIDGSDAPARVAHKLLAVLEKPVKAAGHDIYISCSVGISLFPSDGEDGETLLRCADSAMYEAKEQGRSTYRFYRAEQTWLSRERFALESGLRRALEHGELRLFYQPQADCASGRLTGAEALVRWQHPELGLVPPDRFIPIAEEIGLIGAIGDWVLHTACAQARQWARQGRPLRVAVNLSSQQIAHDTLFDTVSGALERTGLAPELLELEITEGHILKNVEECIAEVLRVKVLGTTVAIDDFGTGYSSLSYLKRLPVDRLKIDRSFVADIPGDRDDVAIVATILSIAHNLGMQVIAEGVETREQFAHLVDARCSEYQGYLLGKPMPPDEFDAWLSDYLHAGARHEQDSTA